MNTEANEMIKHEETMNESNSAGRPVDGRQSDSKAKGKKSRKKGRGKWIIWILVILAVLAVAVLAGIYVTRAMYYKTHFLENTTVNGISCDGLEAAEVAEMYDSSLEAYQLTVTGRNFKTGESGAVLGTISGEEIQLAYADTLKEMEELLEEQNIWDWLSAHSGKKSYNYDLVQGVVFDKDRLEKLLAGWESFQPEHMVKVENAAISQYSEQLNRYEVIPETRGTEFDTAQVFEAICQAVMVHQNRLDIEELGVYEEPSVRQDDEAMNEAVDTANTWLQTRITYDWNGTEVILDKKLLKDWISVGDEGAVLDEKKVESFVREQAYRFDTYGKDRKFMTTLGIELTLPSGYYGWKTDTAAETEALLGLIAGGSVEKREPVYSSTARKKGMSDIGDSYVEADMTHQHMYLYSQGKLVLETDFVSGNMSNDSATPEGVFGLAYKTTNAILRGRDYAEPVSYWMPYYGNYGMHDAQWRTEFGGDIYLTDGSHGCLNLPLENAAVIYSYMTKGFPIICYYYDVDPLPKQPEEEKIVYEFNPYGDEEEE